MGSWKCDPENSNLKGLPGGVPGGAGHTECGWDGSTHWGQKVLQSHRRSEDKGLGSLRVNEKLTRWARETGDMLLRQSWGLATGES